MKDIEKEEISVLIDKAVAGDKESLEAVVLSVQDLVFSLSLRMLGTFPDAEDAAQDIILKIITHLSSYQKQSLFSTWVFRIAVNHLIDYKKHMFASRPVNFEYYGADIENAQTKDLPDLTQNVDQTVLAEELKMSCTNVMLQCLDPESRCIFVLGTMFHIDSHIAGEIFGITAEAYRKRLSRIRRKVADFLATYCGEYGSGKCRCTDRINYAIQNHRLNPAALEYTAATGIGEEKMVRFKDAMEEIDALSAQFAFCKAYESPERTKRLLRELLQSASLTTVKKS